MAEGVKLDFYDNVLRPDPSRTVVRPFEPGYPKGYDQGVTRTYEIIDRIVALDEKELVRQLEGVTASLDENHRDVAAMLRRRFCDIADQIDQPDSITDEQRRLIGAYFSQEYAYEAAALFNPSAVARPDQSGLIEGAVRIVLALRGIGEGHVSSVTFRTGIWSPGSRCRSIPLAQHRYRRSSRRLMNTTPSCGCIAAVAGRFLKRFYFQSFPASIRASRTFGWFAFRMMMAAWYITAPTPFSGAEARSELLTTADFHSFEMRPLTGDVASTKGMALFPRRVDGSYVMLGRQDNKNIWLSRSDDLLHWQGGAKLVYPRYPWEFVQMGNCGSPIELDEAWLVMTHGVGTVRNYCVGACLLNKHDPSKLLARTPRPVLAPSPHERDGYVPNVVYSCGALIQDRQMLLPYAVADSFTTFATLSVDDLLRVME